MKKLFFLLITSLLLISCLSDDTQQTGIIELTEIQEVTVPDEVAFGQTYDFEITMKRPTLCHGFQEFQVDRSNSDYVLISAIVEFSPQVNCEEVDNESITTTLSYTIDRENEITFRFVGQENANGTRDFISKTISVQP